MQNLDFFIIILAAIAVLLITYYDLRFKKFLRQVAFYCRQNGVDTRSDGRQSFSSWREYIALFRGEYLAIPDQRLVDEARYLARQFRFLNWGSCFCVLIIFLFSTDFIRAL